MFRDPRTFEEVARARNLKEMQNAILSVPADSLLYHITRNHVSRWLRSRALFPAAEFVKQLRGKNCATSMPIGASSLKPSCSIG